jgi:hypothetical protein
LFRPKLPKITSTMQANDSSMAVRFDTTESARLNLFDTSSWGPFCDITLTLKKARQSDNGAWVKIDDYLCRPDQAMPPSAASLTARGAPCRLQNLAGIEVDDLVPRGARPPPPRPGDVAIGSLAHRPDAIVTSNLPATIC